MFIDHKEKRSLFTFPYKTVEAGKYAGQRIIMTVFLAYLLITQLRAKNR